MDDKLCTGCGSIKLITEFYNDKSAPDGKTRQCKTCCKQRDKNNYKSNPQKKRDYNRANKERIREYRIANIDRYRGYVRKSARKRRAKYLEEHREERSRLRELAVERKKIRNREWDKKNRDKAKERKRRFYALNPDAKKAYDRTRRARINGAVVEKYKSEDIFERDGWRCQLCGKKINRKLKSPHLMSATIDHIVPLALGGNDTTKNVQAAHMVCNSSKRHKNIGQLRLIG